MVKNFIKIASVILFVAGLFVSCSKKVYLADDHGCYIDIYEAITDAKKQDKTILVMITVEGDDYASEGFIQDIVNTEEFVNEIASKYVVCHMDFSEASYNKSMADENATEEEKKAAEKFRSVMEYGYQYASMLRCEYTPSLYLLTKEGYAISEVVYDDYEGEIFQVETLKDLLASYEPKTKEMKDLVVAANNSKAGPVEQAKAIDNLYQHTAEGHRSLLSDLGLKIPELDKNNESGICSNYIMLAAEKDMVDFLYQGDFSSVVGKYMELAQHPYLSEEDRMNCYFNSAYFLSISGAAGNEEILYYLNQGLAINPENPAADRIREAIEYFNNPQAFE